MSSKHVYWLTVLLLVVLGFGIVGSSYYATKMLNKESAKLVDLKLENRLLEDQQNALNVAKRSIDKYRELDKIARTVLPQDKDQAKAVREIVKLSDESGIKLSNITFPSSNLGAVQPAPLKKDADSKKPKPLTETQVKPVNGIPGVYEMELSIRQDPSTTTTYQNFIDFLSKLEKNRRTAHVTSITVSPDDIDPRQLVFNMTVKLFIKP